MDLPRFSTVFKEPTSFAFAEQGWQLAPRAAQSNAAGRQLVGPADHAQLQRHPSLQATVSCRTRRTAKYPCPRRS